MPSFPIRRAKTVAGRMSPRTIVTCRRAGTALSGASFAGGVFTVTTTDEPTGPFSTRMFSGFDRSTSASDRPPTWVMTSPMRSPAVAAGPPG